MSLRNRSSLYQEPMAVTRAMMVSSSNPSSPPQSTSLSPRYPFSPPQISYLPFQFSPISSKIHFTKSSKPFLSTVLVKTSSSSSSFSTATGFADDIGDVLGDVSIFTATGESVKFKDLWDQEEGIAVVALLRHFGCICCWELADALKDLKASLDVAGVKLIAVGVGTPNKARILAERLPFPLDCLYADPERKAYDVFSLYYGIGRTFFNPASAKVFSRLETLKKAVKNYTIEATPDDRSSVLQQGGMFVFKGKKLMYARKDEGTGDHASLDDILDICCKIPVT